MILIRLLVFVFIFTLNIKSQIAVELFGGKSFLYHNSDFKKVNDFPNCCFLFKSGIGDGSNIGLGVNLSFHAKESIKINLLYNNSTLTFQETQKDFFNLNGKVIQGVYSHNLEFQYKSFSIMLLYGYELNPRLSLLFGTYLDLTDNVNFKQFEKIEEPINQAVFVDTQTRTRNYFESSLLNNVKIGMSPGLEYKMPLNRKENFFLSGNIYFKIDFNSTFKEIKSTENSFLTQLKLIYYFNN
ncbi:MAG: hypothetical protein NTW25_03835 [Candidatus Kapabacteria bacterium]|nr:hypothetical protein [Candidatus Kapabacteria bacterium]